MIWKPGASAAASAFHFGRSGRMACWPASPCSGHSGSVAIANAYPWPNRHRSAAMTGDRGIVIPDEGLFIPYCQCGARSHRHRGGPRDDPFITRRTRFGTYVFYDRRQSRGSGEVAGMSHTRARVMG